LIRVHDRIDECQGPPSFRAWARQIVSHLAIDALRRRKRLNPIDNGHEESDSDSTLTDEGPSPESIVVKELRLDELQNLLNQSPISERSRRVVLGRYVADEPDEDLAETEAKLSGQTVLPSHIQVTRSKNLSKLRDWAPLRTYFEQTG
jgi:RNA polymerase sigma factor (sigma-70 family)